MSTFDNFKSNYELLLYVAYRKHQGYPLVAIKNRKRSSSGIHCKDAAALKKLRGIEKQLGLLNNDILRFFGVDEAILGSNGERRKRGRHKKRR